MEKDQKLENENALTVSEHDSAVSQNKRTKQHRKELALFFKKNKTLAKSAFIMFFMAATLIMIVSTPAYIAESFNTEKKRK